MPITREDASDAPVVLRLDADRKRRFIAAMADRVIAHADELSRLDSAIGDGDHGHNMKRGFEAVLKDVDSLAAMRLPDLLKAIGTKLVMTVGGASGPLYGTLFLTLGKVLPEEPSRAESVAACAAAIAALKARGKSEVGQKTMLDVLVPAQEALAGGADGDTLKGCAARSAEATVPMMATRGRASFLRERSIGHMDPGARSSSLIIAALCDEFVES